MSFISTFSVENYSRPSPPADAVSQTYILTFFGMDKRGDDSGVLAHICITTDGMYRYLGVSGQGLISQPNVTRCHEKGLKHGSSCPKLTLGKVRRFREFSVVVCSA
jgi:hypothetical protein